MGRLGADTPNRAEAIRQMKETHPDEISIAVEQLSLGLTDDTGERVTVIDEFDWEEPER